MTNTLKTIAVAITLIAGMSTASFAQLYPEHFRYDSTSKQVDSSESGIPKPFGARR